MVILLVEGMKSFLNGKVPEPQLTKVVVPLSVLSFSTVLYVAFSYLYPPMVLRECIIAGLILGFMSSGIYSIGKAIMTPVTPPV